MTRSSVLGSCLGALVLVAACSSGTEDDGGGTLPTIGSAGATSSAGGAENAGSAGANGGTSNGGSTATAGFPSGATGGAQANGGTNANGGTKANGGSGGAASGAAGGPFGLGGSAGQGGTTSATGGTGSSIGGASAAGTSASGGSGSLTKCPSGDGNYCGSEVSGDPSTLYDCTAGSLTVVQVCTSGCQKNPSGYPDTCAMPASTSCPSGDGLYCGVSVGGDVNTLYQCTGGALTVSQVCGSGCQVNVPGKADQCAASTPKSCPNGDGAYCGQEVNGDPSTLYECTGGALTVKEMCSGTCLVEPAGTADKCPSGSSAGSCPGSGAYCGGDVIEGDAGTLYECAGAGSTPTVSQACMGACIVNSAGTPDACAVAMSGSCSAHGQAALAWEANQLATNPGKWEDYCLGFVASAYAAVGVKIPDLSACDASGALANAKNDGTLHAWDGDPPCGAVVFWDINKCNAGTSCPDGGYGHVVISNGDGTASTSGWTGFTGNTHAPWSWLIQEECGRSPAGYIGGF